MRHSFTNERYRSCEIRLGGGACMHLWRKGLKAYRACTAQCLERGNLIDIAQPIGGVHQDAVGVRHLAQGHGLIDHARDVDDPSMIGEIVAAMSQGVVKRVMHQLKAASATDGLNRLDRFGFVAQRADFKAEWLDHAGQTVVLQHRLQGL